MFWRLLAWIRGPCECAYCPECRAGLRAAEDEMERLAAALAAVKGERDEWRRRALGVDGERR